MIKKIFILGSLVLISNFFSSQVQIPMNSTDKTSVNKWKIAKVNDSIDPKKIIESEDYFSSVNKSEIKSLNLSKFKNVTFSLYQIFEEINFNNTFIIVSNIESKTESKFSFIYSNYDMASEIYINGEKTELPYGLNNLKFDHFLRKGENSIVIIGKPNGSYKSRFSLKISDKKLSKIKVKVLKENLKPHKLGYFGIKDEKMVRYFQLDENGEKTMSVVPGEYLIMSGNSKIYKWSNKINISENEEKEINLILNQRSVISGNVSTFKEKNPHPGINVKLVNANTNEIFWTDVTNSSGDYSFTPPNGNWKIKLSSKSNKDIYFGEKKAKSIFKINNSSPQ